jgi:hypothetical protein
LTFVLLATVALEIEREDAVQARGASKNLGMAQRADCVVVTRAPMVLHRQRGKLVVFRVTFVVLSPVDQVDDVVDLVTGDRLQDLQIIVLLKIAGSLRSRASRARWTRCTFLNWPVLARVRLEN